MALILSLIEMGATSRLRVLITSWRPRSRCSVVGVVHHPASSSSLPPFDIALSFQRRAHPGLSGRPPGKQLAGLPTLRLRNQHPLQRKGLLSAFLLGLCDAIYIPVLRDFSEET